MITPNRAIKTASLDFLGVSTIQNLPDAAELQSPVTLAQQNGLRNEIKALIEGKSEKNSARTIALENIDLSGDLMGLVVNGVTLADGDILLLAAQDNEAENWLYVYDATAGTLTRTDDSSTWEEIYGGMVRVIEGDAGAARVYFSDLAPDGILGTDPIHALDSTTLVSLPAATTDILGIIKLASVEEVKAGVDGEKAVTSASLKAMLLMGQIALTSPAAVKKDARHIDENIDLHRLIGSGVTQSLQIEITGTSEPLEIESLYFVGKDGNLTYVTPHNSALAVSGAAGIVGSELNVPLAQQESITVVLTTGGSITTRTLTFNLIVDGEVREAGLSVTFNESGATLGAVSILPKVNGSAYNWQDDHEVLLTGQTNPAENGHYSVSEYYLTETAYNDLGQLYKTHTDDVFIKVGEGDQAGNLTFLEVLGDTNWIDEENQFIFNAQYAATFTEKRLKYLDLKSTALIPATKAGVFSSLIGDGSTSTFTFDLPGFDSVGTTVTVLDVSNRNAIVHAAVAFPEVDGVEKLELWFNPQLVPTVNQYRVNVTNVSAL